MASCEDVDLVLAGQTVEVFPDLIFIILTAVVGVVLPLLFAFLFLKEIGKKRVQKSERVIGNTPRTVTEDWAGVEEDGIYYAGGAARQTTSAYKKMQKQRKSMKVSLEMDAVVYTNESTQDTAMEHDEDETEGEEEEFETYTSIVTILSKSGMSTKARDKALEELYIQDIRDSWTLQSDIHKEKTSAFFVLLQVMLGKFVASERITETYAKEFVEQYQEKMKECEGEILSDLKKVEQDLKENSRDSLEVEEELELKRPEFSRRLAAVVDSLSAEMRDDLQKNSGLSTDEVEALSEKLSKHMTTAEKLIGEDVEDQSVVLQDRLSKRQALAQQYSDMTARESQGTQTRIVEMKNILSDAVDDQKMTQSQVESILKDYEENLAAVEENYRSELQRQSAELQQKLKHHREAAMAKLQDKHSKEQEKLQQAVTTVVNPSDIVQAHHDLQQQHRSEYNDLVDELDYTEAEALSVARKKLSETQKEEADQVAEKMVAMLAEETRLSEKEAQKMMKKHQANCQAFEEQLMKEKQEQSEMLQKKIQERKAAWEKEKEKNKVEQQQLTVEQEKTVTKVLDSQTGLEEEARKRILQQHEQNTAALNNHLNLTRMRQQKLIEAKLAKRKARMEALKEQQKTEVNNAENEEEAEALKEQHEEELRTELAEYNKEHEKTVAVFRSKIAIETAEMLKVQDQQMGELLGKLQVGQARRRAVIERQDKAIQELQEKLVDTVGDNSKVPEQKTERIIQKHLREVEEVQEKMREAREHQAKILREKYENQKIMREKTLLAQLDENRVKTAKSKQRELSTNALEVLSRIYEEKKQEQAIKQMEQEMKSEMLHQKQEMDRQLEEALKRELEEREKDFLGDLAAVSELRKEELTELVSAAVEDGGGNEGDAKAIKKDLMKRMKNAKSRPDDDDEDFVEEKRSKKKKKGKKK
ncbi:Ellis-van Creveld syndrome protein [Holothuria leucospilota]|uniref:Ellis-van Creveld syndrome protein n=1 Tax=Holothuria leucospilota TaxID=206669 RepID=A0A9Q0YP15_HOLLE|nr:Ellis-van Creveld syndrome protein [Holothuria leucospilota]